MKNIRIGKFLHEMITAVLDSALYPTGKYLAKSLIAAVILLIVSIISELCGYFYCISWQGWLGAVIVLGVLCFMERSEYHEIHKLYRDMRTHAENIKAWEETERSRFKARRGNDVCGHVEGECSERPVEGRELSDLSE